MQNNINVLGQIETPIFYANYVNDLGETEIHFKPHANCINVTGQIGLHLISQANNILFFQFGYIFCLCKLH